VVGWIYEDELPRGYPYDAMFPFSKVDGVRLFPANFKGWNEAVEAAVKVAE
jgi:hypothetical protein